VSGPWVEDHAAAVGQRPTAWPPPPTPPPPPVPAPTPSAAGGLRGVLEAVVVGPGDTLGLRIEPGSPAEMDEAAARIFADVKRWRPELEGRVLVVAAEQVFAVRGEAERP
jgi:hypothetical protein